MSLKILIVEDKAMTRAALQDLLSKRGYDVVATSAEAEEAWLILKQKEVDIALIDIHLAKEKTGIWLAEQIRTHLDIPFVFLTAYGDERTLEEVKATKPDGYLMKPYNKPTLYLTLEIAFENFAKNHPQHRSGDSVDSGIAVSNTLYVKSGFSLHQIQIHDIFFVKSDGNYLHIILENERRMIRSTLKEFAAKLPDQLFYRIHKSYIVNIKKVSAFHPEHLEIASESLPIAKQHKREIIEAKERLSGT